MKNSDSMVVGNDHMLSLYFILHIFFSACISMCMEKRGNQRGRVSLSDTIVEMTNHSAMRDYVWVGSCNAYGVE